VRALAVLVRPPKDWDMLPHARLVTCFFNERWSRTTSKVADR
jgi:hypothetical protein